MIGVVLVLLLLVLSEVMTTSLTILAISGIIIAVLYKWPVLFKKAYIWYIIALLVAITSMVLYTSDFIQIVTRGYLPYAIFFVVMMVGVLPNKWTLTRSIKKHRGTLSIVGFILISPHAFLHVFDLYSGVNLFGIVAYVLMIPLTIVSFKIIKREIKPKDWLTVQKAAYVIYLSLFIHLIYVGAWVDKIIYAVLFTIYVNNKLYKEWKR